MVNQRQRLNAFALSFLKAHFEQIEKIFLFLLCFSIGLLIVRKSHALIDTRNANYSQCWVDIQLPGAGYDMKIERCYNSRVLSIGNFGYGWCSNFETKLDQTAEGYLKISECGAGQETVYMPREDDPKKMAQTAQKIVQKLLESKKVTATRAKELEKELASDHDLRANYARELKIAIPAKDGTHFFANGKEVDTIVLEKGNYSRTLADGTKMKFNQQGRLTHLYDKNGNYIKLDYEKDLLKDIQDNAGRRLAFKFQNRRVKSITVPNGTTIDYKFANLDDLASVKNMWGNTYTYEYDDLHNMTKAGYPDGTFIALKYDKKNDWVTQYQDRDKCAEDYAYEADAKTPTLHYWSTLVKTCAKEVTNRSKFEFWLKERSDGQTVMSRVATTINNDVTDVTYHEIFGKPVVIRKGNIVYEFEYFPNGQMKEKKSPTTKLVYQYDNRTRKVAEVVTSLLDQKGKSVQNRKTQFHWDDKGNLKSAANSDGQTIEMSYDQKGRISTFKDHAKKLVKIAWDEKVGKPSTVERPGIGLVQIFYKNNGEIEKVESKDGAFVAKQVIATFSNYMEVISPASAELYN